MDLTKQLFAVSCILVAAAVVVERCGAADYVVGGDRGWSLGGFNYAAWSSQHRFHSGDVLVFRYSAESHNVLQVSQQDYRGCSTSRPIMAASGGNNRVRLTRGGSYWFICGVAGHCAGGMRFQIQVGGSQAAATTTAHHHMDQEEAASTQNEIINAYPTA